MWLDALTTRREQALAAPVRVHVRGRSMAPTLLPGDEVLIEPVTADALQPGDWVVVRDARSGYVHRFLGLRNGQILTKGDGHVGHDPLWEPGAVVGRVREARRDGQCFYSRTSGPMRRQRVLAAGHRAMGDVWGLLRRLKALLWALFAVLLGVTIALAAVTLVSFEAEATDDRVILRWETASETNNLGFYIWRSQTEIEGYVEITGFLSSLDEGAGSLYEFEDLSAEPGVLFYYRLQDVPSDGSTGKFTEPVTASIPLPQGAPTWTPTPTKTPTSTPTATPNPNVRFWADATSLNAGDCTTLQWQTTNIQAVYLDGDGVLGDGARTMCPCETTTYVLTVDYQDGSTENFSVIITVIGECTDAQRTGTPTPTLRPTVDRPVIGDSPTATATPFIARPSATATPPATNTRIPSPTPTLSPTTFPTPTLSAATATSSPAPTVTAQATRGVVEGASRGVGTETALSIWLLIVGGIVGLGFVGAGILMWKQRQ